MRALVTGAEYGTHTRRESHDESGHGPRSMPMLLTVDDAAELLRADDLLHWLNQKSAPSLRSEQR